MSQCDVCVMTAFAATIEDGIPRTQARLAQFTMTVHLSNSVDALTLVCLECLIDWLKAGLGSEAYVIEEVKHGV